METSRRLVPPQFIRGGYWEYTRKLPDRWTIHYEELAFHVKPTGFKHTGLFPEQAVNWRWIQWAKENAALSGLNNRAIRFITDDVLKFIQREQRRGRQYDAIIMDPPSYGRGPKGETWKLEQHLYSFIEQCMKVLSPHPLFVLINSYTTMISPSLLHNLMALTLQKQLGGRIITDEIGLPVTSSGLVLPAGILGRWEE